MRTFNILKRWQLIVGILLLGVAWLFMPVHAHAGAGPLNLNAGDRVKVTYSDGLGVYGTASTNADPPYTAQVGSKGTITLNGGIVYYNNQGFGWYHVAWDFNSAAKGWVIGYDAGGATIEKISTIASPPRISSFFPLSLTASDSRQTLTIYGSNFSRASAVEWRYYGSGSSILDSSTVLAGNTTYYNSGRIVVSILTEADGHGAWQFRVKDGGEYSSWAAYTVDPQAQTSAPSSVSSPVYGDLHVVTTWEDCDKGCANGRSSWCFNQHKRPGHISIGGTEQGIGKANDTYAWDANLNCPSHDSDNGMPVYAIEDGVVETSYGSLKNTNGTVGQVLIRHGSSGSNWWSGYLHMKNRVVSNDDSVSKGQKIGEVSNKSGQNTPAATPGELCGESGQPPCNHLHFVVYTGTNAESSLASYDAAINARHTLTLTAIGNGTVTPTPDGVSCGTNCYGYDAGTYIQLSESLDAGSSFSAWSGGGCSGTGKCQLTIQSNQSISATFSASGASAPDLTVGDVTVADPTVDRGQSVALTATVRNTSTATAENPTLRYLLSDDIGIATSDSLLCTKNLSSLSAGAARDESKACPIPSDLSCGEAYYVGVCVDPVSGESNTSDSSNCSANGTRITVNACPPGTDILSFASLPLPAVHSGNVQNHSLSGGCAAGENVTLTVSPATNPVSASLGCPAGTWSASLDLSALDDGTLSVTLEQTGQASIYATVVKDTIAPVITATDRALTAQGIMTAAVVSATADDARDGVVQSTGVLMITSNRSQPSPRSFASGDTMRLPSGRHQITWTARDAVGNVSTAQSVVDIHPLVAVAPGQRVGAPTSNANLRVEVPVRLSGNAPFYPVAIPYSLSFSSNMSAGDVVNVSPPNAITLSQGTQGAVTFDIRAGFSPSDGNAATVRLSLLSSGLSSQVAISPRNANHAVGVLPTGAANLKPKFHSLRLSQSSASGITSKQVARDAGMVDVRAQARDPDGDALSFDFSVNGPLPNRSSALFSGQASGSDSASFAFSPAALELGKTYLLSLIITDADNASIHVAERFKVVALDDDRVSDQDMDGVPDASDYVDVPNAQPISSDPAEARMAQSPVGTQLRLGERAELAASSVALSAIGGSVSVGDDTFNIVDRNAVYDFEVLGGDSDVYRVVLPLSTPTPSNALYLKQDRDGNWARFDDSGADALASADSVDGICPGPDEASSYGAGLLAGRDCLLLTLVDGGPNDADGFQNGQVADPGTVVVVPPHHGGGGVIDPWALLILLLLVTYCVQRYGGKQRHLRHDAP